MSFFSILAAVGLLALAGAGGVALGIIEKHIMEDDRSSRNE
jgi:hypothetical protein